MGDGASMVHRSSTWGLRVSFTTPDNSHLVGRYMRSRACVRHSVCYMFVLGGQSVSMIVYRLMFGRMYVCVNHNIKGTRSRCRVKARSGVRR